MAELLDYNPFITPYETLRLCTCVGKGPRFSQ